METPVIRQVILFFFALLFSGMFLDDLIENIIYFVKEQRMNIFSIRLFILAIIFWTAFYFVTLI